MPSRARIGLAETDREVLCQAYEQAKQHPRREATPGDDDDLPKWLGAEMALLQRGYADAATSSLASSGKISLTTRGMRAARLICDQAEGFTELLLPVGSRSDGTRTQIALLGRKITSTEVILSRSDDEKRDVTFTLYDTEEGPMIFEEEWLTSGSVQVQPGQPYAELTEEQSRLLSIGEARADNSVVMREVLERFSKHL